MKQYALLIGFALLVGGCGTSPTAGVTPTAASDAPQFGVLAKADKADKVAAKAEAKEQKAIAKGGGQVVAYTTVSTIAGDGTPGWLDGPALSGQMNMPWDVAADPAGNVYIADYYNNRIRKVDTAGVMTTLAGTGEEGYMDGPGATAQLRGPATLAADGAGNVYFTDMTGNHIRKINALGVVSTFVGNVEGGFADGSGDAARFYGPGGLGIDRSGNLYVADSANEAIRRVDPAGNVTTVAAGRETVGYPMDVTPDASGNLFWLDDHMDTLRKRDASGNVTIMAGRNTSGYVDGPGATAVFMDPRGLVVDAGGNVYIAERGATIRKVDPAGNVSSLTGSSTTPSGYADGDLATAQFNGPFGIGIDSTGRILVADSFNHRIRRIQ